MDLFHSRHFVVARLFCKSVMTSLLQICGLQDYSSCHPVILSVLTHNFLPNYLKLSIGISCSHQPGTSIQQRSNKTFTVSLSYGCCPFKNLPALVHSCSWFLFCMPRCLPIHTQSFHLRRVISHYQSLDSIRGFFLLPFDQKISLQCLIDEDFMSKLSIT